MRLSALATLPALAVTGIDGADATLISRATGGISATCRADTVRIESGATGDTDARVAASGTGRVTITGGARCTVEDGATTRVTCG